MNYECLVQGNNPLTPVVIGGVARSGTRMIADILSQHKHFRVEDEMHDKSIEAYFNFLDTVQANFDHYSERKGRRLDRNWKNNKIFLHHIFLSVGAKNQTTTPFVKDIHYHAFKTPGHKRYFEQFEKIFSPVKPLYIYAIRDVGAVWRSWVTREFTNEVDLFKSRYERSLRQALKIKRNAPGRFALFDLEAYINTEHQQNFIRRTILDKLLIEDLVVWPENGIENINSASALGLELHSDPQLKAEMKSLQSNEKIQKLLQEVRS